MHLCVRVCIARHINDVHSAEMLCNVGMNRLWNMKWKCPILTNETDQLGRV